MSAYLIVDRGTVRRVAHKGRIGLSEIYEAVESPFCVGMSIHAGPDRRIEFLVNDEGLFQHEAAQDEIRAARIDPTADGKPHRWAMTFIRPSDGSPLVGPMLVCAADTREGEFLPLTQDEARTYYQAFVLLGFGLSEDVEVFDTSEH